MARTCLAQILKYVVLLSVWFHAVQVLMISCAVTLLAGLVGAGVHIFSPSLEKRKRRSATATFFIILGAGESMDSNSN